MTTEVSADQAASIRRCCIQWNLVPDGAAFATNSSILAPVRRDGEPAMLKVATVAEEVVGNAVMAWWNGRGAAAVLEYDDTALVLARSVGTRSLETMAEGDADGEATRILCGTATRLHTVTGTPPVSLPTLADWFAELAVHARSHGGFFARADAIASGLLAHQSEAVVLHGDVHHGNVLDFGPGGWLAIDPKGIIGDRAFDFVNILCNPSRAVATRPGRLERQVGVIADAVDLDPERLLRWTIAWGALSSAWSARGNQSPWQALEVGLEAEHLLGG